MNKTQLVDVLAARLGDRRTAVVAVDGVLEAIVHTVGAGEAVSITGFGVFEARARAARTARNPRTGATVQVPATRVPAFRPGAGFRAVVAGSVPAPALPGAAFEPQEVGAPVVNGVAPKPARRVRATARPVETAAAPAADVLAADVLAVPEAAATEEQVVTNDTGGPLTVASARRTSAFTADAPAVAPAEPRKRGKGKQATKGRKVDEPAKPSTVVVEKPAKRGKKVVEEPTASGTVVVEKPAKRGRKVVEEPATAEVVVQKPAKSGKGKKAGKKAA